MLEIFNSRPDGPHTWVEVSATSKEDYCECTLEGYIVGIFTEFDDLYLWMEWHDVEEVLDFRTAHISPPRTLEDQA